MHRSSTISITLALSTLISVSACGLDDREGINTGNGLVSLSTGVPLSNPGALTQKIVSTVLNNELVLVDAQENTLVLSEVELVLRAIEFERADELVDCDAATESDACEEFELGPLVIEIPVDGSVQTSLQAEVAAGIYDEIEFEIHRLGNDLEDAALLQQRPDLGDVSLRAAGRFNDTPFLYTNDLDEEQELQLIPPLVVDAGDTAINVTLSVDLSLWFTDLTGTLIAPQSANTGGANESIVEQNIKQSLESFEDDDSNGVRDN